MRSLTFTLITSLLLLGLLKCEDNGLSSVSLPSPGDVVCYPVYEDSLVRVVRCDSVAESRALIRRIDTVWLVPEGEAE